MEHKLTNFAITQDNIKREIDELEGRKIEKEEFREFTSANEERVLDLEDAFEKHDNNIKSLENFLEKYVPCQTQNLIIENLK